MNILNKVFPDYFTQADRNGVWIASVFSLLALTALIEVTAPTSKKEKKPIAKFESISNQVQHKDAETVSFYDSMANEFLQNNDEVFTADNSNAQIKFIKSNTVLTIPPSSLIRIEESENGESIEVKQGFVDILLEKGHEIKINSGGVAHLLKSQNEKSKIKAYYTGGELKFFSPEKGVSVDGDIINKGFQVSSPTPGERVEVEDGLKIVTSEKGKYQITLSKNADFTSQVIKTKLDGVSLFWKQDLTEGEYFLKVEDKTNHKTIPIFITSKFKIDGLSPAKEELVTLNPGEKTKLSWNPKAVYGYKVTIKDSEGTENQYFTQINELTIDNLKGSAFEWTVVPEITKGRFHIIPSRSQAGLRFNGRIDLSSNLRKLYKITEKSINISWNSTGGNKYLIRVINSESQNVVLEEVVKKTNYELPIKTVGKYKLEISSVDYPSFGKAESNFEIGRPVAVWDSEMKKELHSSDEQDEYELKFKQVEGSGPVKITSTFGGVESDYNNTSAGKVKLGSFGDYCFKVAPYKSENGIIQSDDFCMKYTYKPPFRPIPKASDIVMVFEKHKGVDSYKITVPVIEKAAKYHFEVYRDANSKSLVYSMESIKPEVFWASNRSGIYFLKYKALDVKNRPSEFSPMSKLIFPISPLSDW